MIEDTSIYLAGSTMGFMVFILGLTSMDGIFKRPNLEGVNEYTLENLKQYLKAPFEAGTPNFDTVWTIGMDLSLTDRLKLLQLNWLLMTFSGLSISAIIVNILKFINL